jgi:predicted lipoprotein with Yx(FWY)xxD motif
MKPTNILRAAVIAAAAASATATATAVAGAQAATPTAHASRVAKVELRHTHIGTILTTSSGFTLYEFTRDHGANSCVKIATCSGSWPALQTTARPVAGPGVHSSMLSTTALPGGKKQVTYAGHPLYLYDGDTGPAETSYVGERAFGGDWDAITASGHAIK